jgi:hypothetical protein
METPPSRIDPTIQRAAKECLGKGGNARRFAVGSIRLTNHETQEVWSIDPKGF